jgi:acyl carrier protein
MMLPSSPPVAETVIEIVKDVSRRPIEPTLASDLVADLAFDSLQVMETIAELEDRFEISIPPEDVPTTRTVAHVVARVEALLETRRPS